MPKKRSHGGKRANSGRSPLPPALRKVPLLVYVPKRIKAILLARVKAQGVQINAHGRPVRRSSLSVEVERAILNSEGSTR